MYILLAIVLLGILIAIHEYGHFIAARLTGIAVKEFSIGFGPKFLQWKSKKYDTVFSIRPIPLGGYCMFYGDTDDDPQGEKADDPRNYNRAAVWKRMLSVISGPLMNFVFAFVVAVVLMAAYGLTLTQPYVSAVDTGAPAEAAGILPGDVFLQIGDHVLMKGDAAGVTESISVAQEGVALPILVERNGEDITLQVFPVLDAATQNIRIGIMLSAVRPLRMEEVIPSAWNSCVFASGAILNALGKMVTTGEGLDGAAGPVGMVQMVAQETQNGGLEIFLNMMVLISINLGLLNLLPIPGLDGSRIVFFLIEAVRGKPVSQRVEGSIHMMGYALLFGMMLFFTFRDVGRLFGM